jgi:hypothetical protein
MVRQRYSSRAFFASLLGLLASALASEPALGGAEDESGGKTILESAADTSSKNVQSSDLGTGNFGRSPFRVSVSVREGYDDNVYTTNENRVDSFFTNGNVVIGYKFGDAQTRLDVEASGGATYYYDRPFGQQYDINSGLTLTINHQATPRLGLAAAAFLAYQSEPDFSTGFGVNRRSGNYFYTSDKFSTSYQWTPRFSTATSYTLGVIQYEDSSIGAYEDRFEHTFGNEFRFLILPTTTLVAEYRYELIDYDTAPRDSMTHFALAGFDHSFSPHFNVSLRGGAQFREFDNFDERSSPYGEGTVTYSLGPRTSISWMNRYGLDEPDVPLAPSRTTFRTGLTAGFALTTRITSSLTLFYQHDENEGILTLAAFVPSFDEDSIDIGVGLRYEINRNFAAIAGYNHTEVLSDIALREYSRNRCYLGLNATF